MTMQTGSVASARPDDQDSRRLRFRAMGTDVEIIVVGHPDLAAELVQRARSRVDQLEQRWSRFLPDSEVSLLNRCAGATVTVSDETVVLVRVAIEAWRLSGGSVDPTVLGALIRAGYDRSFDELGTDPDPVSSWLLPGCGDIAVDGNAVRMPAGTGFDPGGIGKGLAADVVAGEMMQGGADGVCVNLGGDLRVIGAAPQAGGWTVAVEHPWSDAAVAHVGLADGALATSTTLRRTWRVDGEVRHHLIDPATGRPSDTDLTSVTVVAGTAWVAEVLAKAVLLRGSAHPFDLVGGLSVDALAVDDRGRIAVSDGFPDYVGSAALPATIAMSTEQVHPSSRRPQKEHR
ncbi:MAG: FAD:protein FMN transferase [Actinomycetota bacterium]|nr:FAD:protein FMN transferase [Actinomycetota bacterium]